IYSTSLPPPIFPITTLSSGSKLTQPAILPMCSQLKNEGRIRMFQHGFEADFFVVAFTDSYISKVGFCQRGFARTVKKFLDSVLTVCPDISFDKKTMLRDFGFRDTEITQLVNAGVLTVRDAGSWWLAVPGAGRFIKCFIKGRKAVLGMIQKSKYKEVLLSDLQSRQAPNAVKLGLPYHIHDIIGAQLVDCDSLNCDKKNVIKSGTSLNNPLA
uniref:Serine/threonine kinase 19 n=1 Tax=Laticauda laticaudata TaxID=8630 RepID=A0A8C5SL71_LATLA